MNIMKEKQDTINQYIDQLLEKKEQGYPFCAYLYDLRSLKRHVSFIKESLPEFCQLYYAMKANPDVRILKALADSVDGFEAASGEEIKTAKKISQKPIIFGAPAKKDYELKQISEGDVHFVNIESFHDVKRLQYWAEMVQKDISVVVRVNLKDNVSNSRLKMSGVPTQFGVDEYNIPKLLEELTNAQNLQVKGFHFHAMSNNLDAHAHVSFIELCIEKALAWRKKYKLNLASVVNVGGGVGVNYTNPEEPFSWVVLSKGLHQFQEKYRDEEIELLLELGRYMVAECGYYAAEVIDIKENHNEIFALLRGGTHHFRLPAAWKMSHPFTVHPVAYWPYPFERPMVQNKQITLAGELCTPNDVLARKVSVKEVKAGDIITFHLAGAYGWTISHHNFLSHPHPDFYYIEDSIK